MLPTDSDQIWAIYEPGLRRMASGADPQRIAMLGDQPDPKRWRVNGADANWLAGANLTVASNTNIQAAPPDAPGPHRWRRNGSVAIVPVQGVIQPAPNALLRFFGIETTTPDSVASAIQEALDAPDVEAIVLDVDSPGGSVSALPEAVTRIEALRASAKVPIVAMSRYLMASAAYWLAASAAHQVVVSPSSLTGSIGVLTYHIDASALYEMVGLNISIIHAGRYKAELSDTVPLSDEARAHLQAHVDYYYEDFVGSVARSRRMSASAVRDGMADGRVQVAREAVAVGMADRVEDMDALMARLAMPRQRRAILRAEADGEEIADPPEPQPKDDDGAEDQTEEEKETVADAVAAVLEERYGTGH